MNVKIQLLHTEAIVPRYATAGAACFDLHALLPGEGSYACIHPGTPTVIRTGLAFEVPEGHVMLVYSRSGHGFKNNVRLANCVGVIDSDYRGEVQVKLTRDEHEGGDLVVHHGDRIAQAMIIPVQQVNFDVVPQLSDTARGSGGFGSSGS